MDPWHSKFRHLHRCASSLSLRPSRPWNGQPLSDGHVPSQQQIDILRNVISIRDCMVLACDGIIHRLSDKKRRAVSFAAGPKHVGRNTAGVSWERSSAGVSWWFPASCLTGKSCPSSIWAFETTTSQGSVESQVLAKVLRQTYASVDDCQVAVLFLVSRRERMRHLAQYRLIIYPKVSYRVCIVENFCRG